LEQQLPWDPAAEKLAELLVQQERFLDVPLE